MHVIVFNDMKSKHFWNALRYSSLYVMSSIRQLVAQELDTIHALYMRASFVDQLRESKQSLLGFDWTCVGVHQKRINTKTQSQWQPQWPQWQLHYWLQKAYITDLDFHKRYCMKVFRANGGYHPKSKLGTSLNTNFKMFSIQRKWTMCFPA